MDRVRVGYLGVKAEFQHTGVAGRMAPAHFDAAELLPQTWGEMGWILEAHTPMNRGMEAMGGQIVKRYRIYERELICNHMPPHAQSGGICTQHYYARELRKRNRDDSYKTHSYVAEQTETKLMVDENLCQKFCAPRRTPRR